MAFEEISLSGGRRGFVVSLRRGLFTGSLETGLLGLDGGDEGGVLAGTSLRLVAIDLEETLGLDEESCMGLK